MGGSVHLETLNWEEYRNSREQVVRFDPGDALRVFGSGKSAEETRHLTYGVEARLL